MLLHMLLLCTYEMRLFDTGQIWVPRADMLATRINRFEADVRSTNELPNPQDTSLEHTVHWNLVLRRALREPSVHLDLRAWNSESPEWADEQQECTDQIPSQTVDFSRQPLVLCACNLCEPARVGLAARLLSHPKPMRAFRFKSSSGLGSGSGSRCYTSFMLLYQHQYVATASRKEATVVITYDPALSVKQVQSRQYDVRASLCHMLHARCLADDAVASGEKAASMPLRCEEGNPVTLSGLMELKDLTTEANTNLTKMWFSHTKSI